MSSRIAQPKVVEIEWLHPTDGWLRQWHGPFASAQVLGQWVDEHEMEFGTQVTFTIRHLVEVAVPAAPATRRRRASQ